jgi:hypothetical protein
VNPNALAYGLGTDLFASILEFIFTQVNSTATLHVFMGQTVEAYHPLKKSGGLFQLSGVLTPTLTEIV